VIELLQLYTGAIVAGLLCAAALALLGCHLVSRNQSLHSLVLSQAATVGVLVGAAIGLNHQTSLASDEIPLLTGLLFSTLALLISAKLEKGRRTTSSSTHLAFFAMLLAMSYWLVSFFPSLENHFSQAFFGDIVTLSGKDLWVSSGVSVVVLTVLLAWWKPFADQSFLLSVIGDASVNNRTTLLLFQVLSLLLICTSIYAMGFLFTMAFLLLPTVILSYSSIPSIKRHITLTILSATLGFAAGFVLSLHFERISTVPTIVLTTGLVSVVLLALASFHRHLSHPAS